MLRTLGLADLCSRATMPLDDVFAKLGIPMERSRMDYIAIFFAGAFLCNSIPHLVAGLQGAPFQTPFAKPRGVGLSPPLVNFLWGIFNLVVGALLLSASPVEIGFNPRFAVLTAGALTIGTYLSLHFGKVRGDG
jgi:hypothetical protein